MRSGLRAFRHRNYRLFFAGQAISLVGTWMQAVAQGWLVLQLTHDPLWLGLVAVAQFGPVILIGPFGGLIADQLPKRRTLVFTQAVAMVLAFVLFGLTATGVVEVWHVLVLASLLGVTNALDMPARQAFAVEMVGREDMTNAVAFNSTLFNASRIVGPAIAGLLIGTFDISVAFLVNGISFLGTLVGYLAMRESELRRVEPLARPTSLRDVFDNLGEGARYVAGTPVVLLGTVLVGLGATFGMNFQVLVPPLADGILHVGASGFGFLMAASGIGSTLVSLRIAFSRHGASPRLIPLGVLGLGFSSLILAFSTSFPLSIAAMALGGIGGIGMAVTANTTIQTVVPDQLRGRVIAVYGSVFMGSVPLGGVISGWIASAWGVPAAFAICGAVTVAIGALGWVWLQRVRAAGGLPRRESVRVPTTAGAGDSGLGVAHRR